QSKIYQRRNISWLYAKGHRFGTSAVSLSTILISQRLQSLVLCQMENPAGNSMIMKTNKSLEKSMLSNSSFTEQASIIIVYETWTSKNQRQRCLLEYHNLRSTRNVH
ncbi:hypothetical protein PanWU01x14_319730, partial [Parasponia andersonii]